MVLLKYLLKILKCQVIQIKLINFYTNSIFNLFNLVEYEDELSFQDNRVKFFWEAISNFSNEERSKFLRFVTGRKRLPVKIFFCSSDQYVFNLT